MGVAILGPGVDEPTKSHGQAATVNESGQDKTSVSGMLGFSVWGGGGGLFVSESACFIRPVSGAHLLHVADHPPQGYQPLYSRGLT